MKTKFKHNSITVYARCEDVDSMGVQGLKLKFKIGGKWTKLELDTETRLEIKEMAHELLMGVKESQDELNFGE